MVHFDAEAARPVSAWVRGVNAHLPDSVAVLWAHEVGGEFHARYSARSRTYAYRLLNRAVRPALDAQYIGWFHLPLDVDAMRAAAALLVGEHDFSAFRSSECQAKSPVRTILQLAISKEADTICFAIRANAFLHHMVRNIAGALLAVGDGRKPSSWIAELLQGRDRRVAAETASAAGLYLVDVEYPAQFGLPQTPYGPLLLGVQH